METVINFILASLIGILIAFVCLFIFVKILLDQTEDK